MLDDELLWGHPWLLDRSLDRRVLICCSDKNNPARQSYRRGEEAFAAVCADVGITETRVLDQYHSEFYKLRTRGLGEGPLLSDWWFDALEAAHKMAEGCDYLVTHNPALEYGHSDHGMVRRLVMEMIRRPVVKWTNARVPTSTWPLGTCHDWGEFCGGHTTDPEWFAHLKSHYVSRDCWTWSRDEPLDVTIYQERRSEYDEEL